MSPYFFHQLARHSGAAMKDLSFKSEANEEFRCTLSGSIRPNLSN
jgi:hypothetical protein